MNGLVDLNNGSSLKLVVTLLSAFFGVINLERSPIKKLNLGFVKMEELSIIH